MFKKVRCLAKLHSSEWVWTVQHALSVYFRRIERLKIVSRTKVDVNLHGRKKNWTIKNLYGNVYLAFFCIFNEFLFCYVLHFFTHWLTNTSEKYQKRKRKRNIYSSQTRIQLHTNKKERKKETHPSTFFSIYMKKLIKINNKWSTRRKDCMLLRYIFEPFHIVGLQLIVWLSDHCLD